MKDYERSQLEKILERKKISHKMYPCDKLAYEILVMEARLQANGKWFEEFSSIPEEILLERRIKGDKEQDKLIREYRNYVKSLEALQAAQDKRKEAAEIAKQIIEDAIKTTSDGKFPVEIEKPTLSHKNIKEWIIGYLFTQGDPSFNTKHLEDIRRQSNEIFDFLNDNNLLK